MPRQTLPVPTRMATAFSFAQALLFSKTSLSLRTNGLKSFAFCLPFSSSSAALSCDKTHSKKWRQPVVSVLELGGVKIAKDGKFHHFLIFFTLGLSFLLLYCSSVVKLLYSAICASICLLKMLLVHCEIVIYVVGNLF